MWLTGHSNPVTTTTTTITTTTITTTTTTCVWMLLYSSHWPGRQAGDVWFSQGWHLVPFPIASLVFLPSPLALSVLSFFCQWSILLTFCQKTETFLIKS